MTDSNKRDIHVLMNGSYPGELYRRIVPESVRYQVDLALAIGVTKHQRWSSAKSRKYYLDAFQRHWEKFEQGEKIDAEDGQTHLSAMIIRLLQLSDQDQREGKK